MDKIKNAILQSFLSNHLKFRLDDKGREYIDCEMEYMILYNGTILALDNGKTRSNTYFALLSASRSYTCWQWFPEKKEWDITKIPLSFQDWDKLYNDDQRNSDERTVKKLTNGILPYTAANDFLIQVFGQDKLNRLNRLRFKEQHYAIKCYARVHKSTNNLGTTEYSIELLENDI